MKQQKPTRKVAPKARGARVWKTDDRLYAPLGAEHDTLSASAQPQPGAYDAGRLFAKQKQVPSNVVSEHAGGPTSPNDTERALDISMGRRSFRRPEDSDE